MIWMANINAGPISASYGSDGQPVPVASSISIAGHTWYVYFQYSSSPVGLISWILRQEFVPRLKRSKQRLFVPPYLGADHEFQRRLDGLLRRTPPFCPDLSSLPSSSGVCSHIVYLRQYLISNEGLSSSQYLTTAQAGTEATSGTAVLTTYALFSSTLNIPSLALMPMRLYMYIARASASPSTQAVPPAVPHLAHPLLLPLPQHRAQVEQRRARYASSLSCVPTPSLLFFCVSFYETYPRVLVLNGTRAVRPVWG